MAETETTVPMDDRALMEGAMAPEPKQEAPAKEPEPGDRPRDELGRFAPKEETTEAAPAEVKPPTEQPPFEPAKDDAEGQVPSWRLREIREARDAAERRVTEREQELFQTRQQMQAFQQQLAQLQKPKEEPVNWFDNPDSALQQRMAPVEERFAQLQQEMRLTTSRAMAIAVHGAKAVTEMEQAIGKAMRENHPDMPTLQMQLRNASDPAEVAMQWHTRTKLLAETGGNLDAYRQKILDDAMKDPDFQAKVIESARGQASQPNSGRPPPINLPPSLNRASGTGASQAPEAGDMSDASLYRFATAKGGR